MVDIVVAVVGEVVVDVVVELLQDANSNDVTNRKDNDAKIMPFFIETSFYETAGAPTSAPARA